ncbi:MAG: hypothetical protein ACREQD_15175, partial [Candidatus Binataceae bacterium]
MDEALAPLATPDNWTWHPGLVTAENSDNAFTLDDGFWRKVITFDRAGERVEHRDRASGNGMTIRFGDGEFGRIPDDETISRRATEPLSASAQICRPKASTSSTIRFLSPFRCSRCLIPGFDGALC